MFELTARSPLSSFANPFQLQREIDELVGRFFGQGPAAPSDGETPTWWPAAESWTSEGTLHVRVALPGVHPKDVEVSVADNGLTIKGQRTRPGAIQDGRHFRREFVYGAFARSLVLPDGVDAGRVTARYTNGMLEITMPAPLSVAPKKVEVHIEGETAGRRAISQAA